MNNSQKDSISIMYIILAISLVLLNINTSLADVLKPLYEAGLAGGVGYIADYPAASQGRVKQIAVPSFLYRGKTFRSDDKGSRARFYKTKNTDIDLSIGASLPSNSNKNDARTGMDDLHWLFEIGPRYNYKIFKTEKYLLNIELPLRAVASSDFQFSKHRGFRFYPQIDFRYRFTNRFKTAVSLKLNWGTEVLNDYFYEVKKSDVIIEGANKRDRYNAKGGYISRDISMNMSYAYKSLFVILGAKFSNFEGAINNRSPLYKSSHNSSVFMAFNFFFWKSTKLESVHR